MQLELVPMEYHAREWEDPNRGKYAEAFDYFWEYATTGSSIDIFKWGVMVSVFFVTKDDLALFPHLREFSQVAMWEDEEEPADSESRVKMIHLKHHDRCFLCKDILSAHLRGTDGEILCEALS